MACWFLLLRRLSCRRADALILTGLAAACAGALFWFPAIETFPLGALLLFPALFIAIDDRPRSLLSHVLAWVFALGINLTNGMVAFFASLLTLTRRRFLLVAAIVTLVLAGLIWEHPRLFWGSSATSQSGAGEAAWVFPVEAGGAGAVMRVFFFGSAVAPEIRMLPNWRHPYWPLMTFQFGSLGTGSGWGAIATVGWAFLLAGGVFALVTLREKKTFRTVLVLSLLYQLLLHLIYGRETFLYAMDYLPLLLLSIALATLTRWRPVVLAIAMLVAVSAAINNARLFDWAQTYTRRADVLKKVRPDAGLWAPGDHPPTDPSLSYRVWREWRR
jgi:hypothetical protein